MQKDREKAKGRQQPVRCNGVAGRQGNLTMRQQNERNDGQIQKQVDLIAARDVEQLPFMPIRRINLVNEKDRGIGDEQGRKQ